MSDVTQLTQTRKRNYHTDQFLDRLTTFGVEWYSSYQIFRFDVHDSITD